jgi:hypothetical protein
METIFPTTSLPNVIYPVMATTTYIVAAEPMLEPITLTKLLGLLSSISLMIENI